jgi:hypothetical protein
MTYLDEDALAGLKMRSSRERKLSTAERIAIYAFAQRGVPTKIISRSFGVTDNSIRYITNDVRTAAHENVKTAYDQMGEERVWAEIVTPAQVTSINEGLRNLFEGKKLNDRRYRRNLSRGARARRAGSAAELPEATSNGEDGGGRAA